MASSSSMDEASSQPRELREICYVDFVTGLTSDFCGKVTFVETNMKERLVAVGFSYGFLRIIRFRVTKEDKKKWKPFNQLICCDKMARAVWSENDQKLITMSDRGTLVVYACQQDGRWKKTKEMSWNLDSISPSIIDNRIAILDNDNCLMFGDPMGDRMGTVHHGDGPQITCFDWGAHGELIYGHENGEVKVVNTGETIDDPVRHRRTLKTGIHHKVVSIQYWRAQKGPDEESRPRLAIAYKNGRIQIRKDVSKKSIHDECHNFEPMFMRWSPDGHSIAIVALAKHLKPPSNTSVYFFSSKGERLGRFRFLNLHNIRGLSWCPSGCMVHVAGDRRVKLLRIEPFYSGEDTPEQDPSESESLLEGTGERIGNMFMRIFNF